MYSTFKECSNKLSGILSIDYFLARELCHLLNNNEQNQHSELLFHSIMATSIALRSGHSCLRLDKEANVLHWPNADENKPGFRFPDLKTWSLFLDECNISKAQDHPLVFEQGRLYLRRYWQFEHELGMSLRNFLDRPCPLDLSDGRRVIGQLFAQVSQQPSRKPSRKQSQSNDSEKTDKLIKESIDLDWQKVAVANALLRQCTIIAGGPGTGKTFTVTKILAALQALAGNSLRIALVAPTGKAAQRLNESIQKAKAVLLKNKLVQEVTLDAIPNTASTIHRLLGVKMGSHNFRYKKNRLLPFDVVLLDEVSMIDLPLMTRLFRALETSCRIIMLGDANQLPSVAAGSVLSDLSPVQMSAYSTAHSQLLAELTGFELPVLQAEKTLENTLPLNLDHLTVLKKSHRFDGSGEIGQLASRVIGGEVQASWGLLEKGKCQIKQIKTEAINDWIERLTEQFYVPLFAGIDPLKRSKNKAGKVLDVCQAFKQLNQFRFLVATRLGEQGVNHVNESIERHLRNRGLIATDSDFYPGRPIMVTENHYSIGLFNGDTGLLWMNEQGKLSAAFPQTTVTDQPVRWLGLGRLPAVETVYAMTIHKTQGSEFAHVALILPSQESKILSRELLYTGITRASSQLSICTNKFVWEHTVARKVQRYSGLAWRVLGIDKSD